MALRCTTGKSACAYKFGSVCCVMRSFCSCQGYHLDLHGVMESCFLPLRKPLAILIFLRAGNSHEIESSSSAAIADFRAFRFMWKFL
jgi:hypothetical protein